MTSHRLQRLSPAKVLRMILVLGVVGKYVFSRQDGRKYGRGLDLLMCRAFKLAAPRLRRSAYAAAYVRDPLSRGRR